MMTNLAPVVEITADPSRHLIRVRMAGVMTFEAMKGFCDEYAEATDKFAGKPHVVLADMRGMRTLPNDLAEMFQATIGAARARGVVLCAHVSDQTVTRLQAGRLARQATPGDDVTIDCDSVEEALAVCRDGELQIRRGTKGKLATAVLASK
jgi:hypothetical protein